MEGEPVVECEECESKTIVVDSRYCMGTQFRKRKCKKCNKIFWTQEIEADIDDVKLMYSIKKMEYRDRKRG